MATYQSNIIIGQELGAAKWGQSPICMVGSIVLPANTLLGVNDIVQLCVIPAHTMLVGFLMSVPDLDTGTTLEFSVEDDLAPTVYVAGRGEGQAGGVLTDALFTTAGVQYATQQILQLLITAAATGAPNVARTINFGATFGLNYLT
jgi:hypothetical protein